MPKKTLVRIEDGLTATSAAYGCAALLDAGLEEQLGPGSAAEEGLGCGGRLAVRIAQRIEWLKHHLVAADEALERIRDELSSWRGRRQRANDELYDQAKALRGFCRGLFKDDEGDRFLGLRGTLPREPKELHAAFGAVVRRLADAEWPSPVHTLEGLEIDRDDLVDSLIEVYDELDKALIAIKTGETREAVAKAARQRAAAAHHTFVDKSCRYLESALELAGLDELAATVRPDIGRRGRPAKNQLAAPATLPGDATALAAAADDRPQASLAAATPAETTHGATVAPAVIIETPEDPV